MLLGDNGIITMAKKAKDEYEKAAKEEQQQFEGAFENKYVTYNGQLHVEKAKLMNEHNEEVRLKGTVLANNKDGKFNKTLLSNLKGWGTNTIKVGLWSSVSNISSIYTDEDRMKEMYQIIDDAIDLDMYVVVIFWSGNNLSEEVYNQATDYFTQIVTKYRDVPNLIYEIANEPSCECNEIKTYANSIIPIIRNISKSALILCPTQGHDSVTKVIGNTLGYDNVMYVAHVYAGNSGDRKVVSQAVLNNIPVFISEWSNGDGAANVSDKFEKETNKFVALMDKYNLSSTFFILGEINRTGSDALVKQGCWDYTLDDNTLSTFGMYAKKYITGTYSQYVYDDLGYQMASDTGTDYIQYFWTDLLRSKISSISTSNKIDIPSDVIYTWDISNEANGNVIAYITDDGTGNNHIVYSYNRMRLFRSFTNCKKNRFNVF